MIATRDSYGEALRELATEDENIVVLDADVGSATKTNKFREIAPKRFFNVGIAEQDMIGLASGLAACGKTVFASTFAVFAPGRCLDQIRNTVAYSNLNVKIVSTHAGLNVGEDGATHQALEDIAIMRAIPNMRVYSPADDFETREVIKHIAKTEGPAYVRLSRIESEKVYNTIEYNFDPLKGTEIKEGKDVSIIVTGTITVNVIKAAEILESKGVSAQIISLHSIKPIDKDIIIEAAKTTKNVVTVEEHNIIGGLGSAVCEVLSENYPVKVLRLGVNDKFGKSGKSDDVIKHFGLDPEGIAENVYKFIKD